MKVLNKRIHRSQLKTNEPIVFELPDDSVFISTLIQLNDELVVYFIAPDESKEMAKYYLVNVFTNEDFKFKIENVRFYFLQTNQFINWNECDGNSYIVVHTFIGKESKK